MGNGKTNNVYGLESMMMNDYDEWTLDINVERSKVYDNIEIEK